MLLINIFFFLNKLGETFHNETFNMNEICLKLRKEKKKEKKGKKKWNSSSGDFCIRNESLSKTPLDETDRTFSIILCAYSDRSRNVPG